MVICKGEYKTFQKRFFHKLIKRPDPVKADPKYEFLLAIFENSKCKQTHMKVKLNGTLSNHWITVLGIPGGHQE